MVKKLFLIDCSCYFYKFYYAIRHLSAPDGTPTNSVYGFCSMLARILKNQKPDYIAAVFDSRGPGKRHAIDPDYKGNRKKMPDDLVCQLPIIYDLISRFNIKSFQEPGMEADDLIASLVSKFKNEKGLEQYIISGDKDLCQTLSDGVFVYEISKDKLMDAATVEKEYGISPSQFVDYQALRGDSIDNIPGVKGVGEKTAVKLLQEFGSLDGIYAGIDRIKNVSLKDALVTGKERAYISRQLAELDNNFPLNIMLSELETKKPDKENLIELFDSLAFKKMKEQLWPCEK